MILVVNSRQEKIRTTADRGKSCQPADLFPNGALRNGHVKGAILGAENGVALVSQFMKVRIVCPYIHVKFELTDKTRAAHEGRNPSFDAVLGSIVWQRGTVSPAPPNHLPSIHVCCGIAWIHAANVRSQRAAIPMRVHGSIIEIIVTAVISAEDGIILVRSKYKRSATSPTSHQFRSDPFLLFRCLPMLPEEITKGADMLFHSEISHIATVL